MMCSRNWELWTHQEGKRMQGRLEKLLGSTMGRTMKLLDYIRSEGCGRKQEFSVRGIACSGPILEWSLWLKWGQEWGRDYRVRAQGEQDWHHQWWDRRYALDWRNTLSLTLSIMAVTCGKKAIWLLAGFIIVFKSSVDNAFLHCLHGCGSLNVPPLLCHQQKAPAGIQVEGVIITYWASARSSWVDGLTMGPTVQRWV